MVKTTGRTRNESTGIDGTKSKQKLLNVSDKATEPQENPSGSIRENTKEAHRKAAKKPKPPKVSAASPIWETALIGA